MTRAGMPAPRAVRTIASTCPITKAAVPHAPNKLICVTAPAICPASDRQPGLGPYSGQQPSPAPAVYASCKALRSARDFARKEWPLRGSVADVPR